MDALANRRQCAKLVLPTQLMEGVHMKQDRLIAIDLAKNVFQLCVIDGNNKVLENKSVRRSQLTSTMARRKPSRVVMESCYSSHYWGRVFQSMGHQVQLIPAQHVKPFVRGNKNDTNDALAIAEAAGRPNIRYVPVKTLEQQDVQALHRIRQRIVSQRTALINQTRGILSEFGVVSATGPKAFKSLIAEIIDPEDTRLTPLIKEQVNLVQEDFDRLTERLNRLNAQLQKVALNSPLCRLLLTIPGIGPLTATATISAIGRGEQFTHARDVAVWLGVTPRQYASGERGHMSGITKRGDRYLRALYVHGARAALSRCKRPGDPVLTWARRIEARRGKHKAVVALASRMARLAWTLIKKQEVYQAV